MSNHPDSGRHQEEEDEEDDYMKMTFTDDPSTAIPETSLQRTKRLKREAEARGRVKSKAELAAEAEARREEALSKSLLNNPDSKKSKGLAMMAKMGFKGGALGSKDNTDARSEPIRISIKDGREGIGLESERKRKLREAVEAAGETAKKAKVNEKEYRKRLQLEAEENRLERQFLAAQKVAERMDDEHRCDINQDDTSRRTSSPDGQHQHNGSYPPEKRQPQPSPRINAPPISCRPLKSLPVVYRGLVRSREEAERVRRMRHDLEQSSSGTLGNPSRLPTYLDPDEDADDKLAFGRAAAATTYVAVDDLDEEDEELDSFEALTAGEKLQRVVMYMREKHRYCFWCKFGYPDEAMEGCPGVEEEDHD